MISSPSTRRVRPLQALGGFDREGSTLYLGTFSKILFPAPEVGLLVLPKSLVEPFLATKAIGDTGTAALEQLALADFINAGHFDRHLRRTTASNAARRKALVAGLRQQFGDRVEIWGANAGLHVFAWVRGKNGGRSGTPPKGPKGPVLACTRRTRSTRSLRTAPRSCSAMRPSANETFEWASGGWLRHSRDLCLLALCYRSHHLDSEFPSRLTPYPWTSTSLEAGP